MMLKKYSTLRKEFLSANPICAVYGRPATEIHHMRGRVGYADEWARDRGITLEIDTRYFLAVCREAHIEIEMNPKWAKTMGYSIDRL